MENVMTVKDRGVVVKVRRAALFCRINRLLALDDRRLYASKSKEALSTLGDFFILDGKSTISETHVDPVEFGRELGVLRPFEDAIGF